MRCMDRPSSQPASRPENERPGGRKGFSTFTIMKLWKLLSSEFLVDTPWLKVAKEKCELPNGKVINDFYTLWQPDWVLILARTKKGTWVMTEQYRHGTGKIALEFPAGIINKGETPEEAAIRELQEECGYGVKGDLGINAKTRNNGSPPRCSEDDKCGYVLDERRENAAMRLQTRDESGKYRGHDNANGKTNMATPEQARGGKQTPNAYDLKPITYLGSFPVNPDRHRGRFHVVFIDGVERLGKTHFDDTEDIETSTITDKDLQAKIEEGSFNHPLQIAGYFKWKLTQK